MPTEKDPQVVGVTTDPNSNGHVPKELFSTPAQSSKNDGLSTVGIVGAVLLTHDPAVGAAGQVPVEILYRVRAVCDAP